MTRARVLTVLGAALLVAMAVPRHARAQLPPIPGDHTASRSGGGYSGILHKSGMASPYANGCTDCHGRHLGGASARSCFVCHYNYNLSGGSARPSSWTIPNYNPPGTPPHNNFNGGYAHGTNDNSPYTGHCTDCHGPTLYGGFGPSCFQCHNQKWSQSPSNYAMPTDHTELKSDGTYTGLHKPGFGTPLTNGCTDCHGPTLDDAYSFVPSCYSCHGLIWAGFGPPADHTELKTDGTFTGLHRPGVGDPIGNGCTQCHGPNLNDGFAPSCFSCHGLIWAGFGPPSTHTDLKGNSIAHAPGSNDPIANGCTQCHGPNLNDGFAPSCFTCHGARWLGETAPPDHTELKGGSVKHKPGAEDPISNGCTQCHGPNLNDGPAPSCFACHGATWVDHDFSARPWLQPGQSSCYPCHDGPDWKHAMSPTIGYTVSTTTLSVQADPTGTSAKCMGCHEGNVAVDDYLNGPATPGEFITGAAKLGTNLAKHHPVSFLFDTALATTHGALNDPATTWSHLPTGGSIRQDLLDAAGDLQCTSCHNQHDNTNGDYLVNPTQTLCFTCHTFSPPPGAHHIPGRDDPWGIASGSDFNCTMCHGANLAGAADGASASACTSCHNSFVFPDLPTPGHHGGDRFDPYRECAACHGAYLQGIPYGTIYAPSCTECHGNLWSGANQPPVVDPGSGGVYTGTVGQTVAFNASGTTDPDADPLAYVWYFGDGSPMEFPDLGVATASHVFSTTGTYQGYLSVTDGINEPVVAPFTVEIVDQPGSKAPDIWNVTTTATPPEVFTLTIEDHGGVFVGIKNDGSSSTSLAVGIEFVGVVFWMDLWMDLSGNVLWGTGNTYFGNINRNAGTMVGIVFDAGGGLATFTGTALP